MTMSLRRLSVLLFVIALAVPAMADEPYWDARPLSEWIVDLRATNADRRIAAADAIAQLAIAHGGSAVVPAIGALDRNLQHPLPAVRESSAGALEQIGQPASGTVDSLLTLLGEDRDPEVRRRAALALSRVAPTSEPVLTAATHALDGDPDAGVRQAAAIALLAGRRAAAPFSSTLAAALSDPDAGVRLYAAAALMRIEGPERGVPVLIGMLQQPDPALRAEAVGMLGESAKAGADVLPVLARALEDDDASVRIAAADALGSVGPPAKSFVSSLGALLRDPNEVVRQRVADALQRIRR